jgi:hypothetical protein
MYQIHDLMDHAPEYVRKRAKREEERKSNDDGKNGGQRRTTADNGAERHTPRTRTRTQLNTGGKAGAFSRLGPADLSDSQALHQWFQQATTQKTPVISDSEADLLFVFSAAERATEHGDNPVALFTSLVSGRKQKNITAAQEERARKRIADLRRSSSTPPVPNLDCLKGAP